jgi:7-carboxy-7-deazaguanine synthase
MLFDGVEPLCRKLKAEGLHITIETAGTIYRDLPCDLMSISPKLANSTPQDSEWRSRHDQIRHAPSVVQRLIESYDYQLKFVVDPESGDDFPEIESLLAELKGIRPDRVILMPEGVDSQVLLRRSKLLVKPCLERNWRLGQRLHIDLFGNSRGT